MRTQQSFWSITNRLLLALVLFFACTHPAMAAGKKNGGKKVSTGFKLLDVPIPTTDNGGPRGIYTSPNSQGYFLFNPGIYNIFLSGKLASQHIYPTLTKGYILEYGADGSLVVSMIEDADSSGRDFSCKLIKMQPGGQSQTIFQSDQYFFCSISEYAVGPDGTIAFTLLISQTLESSPSDISRLIRIAPGGTISSFDYPSFKRTIRGLRYFGTELRMVEDDETLRISREYRATDTGYEEIHQFPGVKIKYLTDGSIQYNNLDVFILDLNRAQKYKTARSYYTNKDGWSAEPESIYPPNKKRAFGYKCIKAISKSLTRPYIYGLGEDGFAYGVNEDPTTFEQKWFTFNYKKTYEAFAKKQFLCTSRS